MDKLLVIIVVCIIALGIAFWIFNNPNGIGTGLDQGGTNVKHKIIEATTDD